jgi:YfiH family protein
MTAFTVRQSGDVQAIVCRPLEDAGFLNAFSTRPGGVSPMPSHDLNLVFNEDDPAHVEENRKRFLRAAGLPSWPIMTAHQVHSADVVEVRSPATAGVAATAERDADALFSRSPGALLAIKTADCVPILIGDPAARFSAAIHAGWRGAAKDVIGSALAALKTAGANVDAVIAAIGPAACARCFEVGPEVAEQFNRPGLEGTATRVNGSFHLDLEDVCTRQLRRGGVRAQNIHASKRCTMHEPSLFFSHRLEGKQGRPVGRMISVVGRPA